MALNGRADAHQICPVLRVDRPCRRAAVTSQFDPELISPRISSAIKGNKAGAPSISQLTAGYGRPARAGAREGRCACGCARSPGGTLRCTSDDGAHLQSYSMLDRRRDLSEL